MQNSNNNEGLLANNLDGPQYGGMSSNKSRMSVASCASYNFGKLNQQSSKTLLWGTLIKSALVQTAEDRVRLSQGGSDVLEGMSAHRSSARNCLWGAIVGIRFLNKCACVVFVESPFFGKTHS